MGRSNRKAVLPADRDGIETGGTRLHWTETHPDRENWDPHELAIARGMSQEAYEAVYGRVAISDIPTEQRSKIFPGAPQEILDKLGREPLSAAERQELLLSIRQPLGLSLPERDPVLSALWKSECLRAEAEQKEFQRAGVGHWMDEMSPDQMNDLRSVWLHQIIGGLAPGRASKSGLWWEDDANGRYAIEFGASSITAAVIRNGIWERETLGGVLSLLRDTNKNLHDKFMKDNILPEATYLTQPATFDKGYPDSHHAPPAQFCDSLWSSLRYYYDEPLGTDISEYRRILAGAMARGGAELEDFRYDPIASCDSAQKEEHPHLSREAIYGFIWNEERGLANMRSGAESVLQSQILRISYGPDESGSLAKSKALEEWKRYCRRPTSRSRYVSPPRQQVALDEWRSSVFPLRHLRPLFAGFGKEQLFSDLEADFGKALKEGRLSISGDPLRDALEDHFDADALGEELEGLPDHLASIIRKECGL